jgi:hypothetical protein
MAFVGEDSQLGSWDQLGKVVGHSERHNLVAGAVPDLDRHVNL